MADVSTLAAFVLASFILVIVPGPSVLFVISRGVALGRRAAVLTVLGNELGMLVQVLLVAAGVGLPRPAFGPRLRGAAPGRRGRHRLPRGAGDPPPPRPVDRARRHGVAGSRHIVREGFIVGLTNPKVIVFFTAVLPQFVDPDGAAASVQMALLGMISITIAFVCDSAWGVLAGTARAWLSGSPRELQRLGGAGGLMMIGLGARLAVTGRND